MRQLKFPTYEYIKSLPKVCTKSEHEYEIGLPLEYEWKLFYTPTSVQGTLRYNDDGSGYVFFDVWELGYTGENDLGLAVKFGKNNYKNFVHTHRIFSMVFTKLLIEIVQMSGKIT